MADPFSVAGTAVGITSLGLQTFQLLYQYYSKAVGYHEDIDRVIIQVAGLRDTLLVLQETTERFSTDGHVSSSQLFTALTSCQDALMRLNEMTTKCCSPKHNQSWKKLQRVKKRLAWPFKQATVKELQDHLRIFQDNLTLALHCAGLDAILNISEKRPSTLDSIVQHSSRVDQRLMQHADLLEQLRVRMVEASGAHQQHSRNFAYNLRELQAEFGRSHDFLARQLLMIQSRPLLGAPMHLRDAHPTGQMRPCRREPKSRQISTEDILGGHLMKCLSPCNCQSGIHLSPARIWSITILSKADGHQAQCGWVKDSSRSIAILLQIVVYTRWLGFCLQIGWSIARKNGWSAIAPTLRYRAVVSSKHSPTFRLFDQAIHDIQYCDKSCQLTMKTVVSSTVTRLPRLLVKDARPTDVDEFGRGIMSVVLEFVGALIRHGFKDSETVDTLLRLCLEQCIPFNNQDLNNRSSVVEWQELMSMNCWWVEDTRMLHDVLIHLIRNGGGWSAISSRDAMSPRLSLVYDSIYQALRFEQMHDAWEEDNKLLRIFLRRSIPDFDYLLRTEHMHDVIEMLLDVDVSRALASWTDGLRVFFSYRPSGPGLHALTIDIWNHALWFDELTNLRIILPFCSLKMEDWTNLNLICIAPYRRFKHQVNIEWKDLLYDTAKQLLILGLLDSNYGSSGGVSEYEIQCFQQPLLFHTENLARLAAESAWAAGCRDMSSERCFAGDEITSGPPLWISTISRSVRVSQKWDIIQWLLKHGADGTWMHPTLCTTPMHVITRLRIGLESDQGDQRSHTEFQNILKCEVADHCKCFCSTKGCRTLGCVVSKYMGSLSWPPADTLSIALTRGRHLAWKTVDENHSELWMASTILRVLTFERLSLTHTCCYRILDETIGYFTRPSLDIVSGVHCLEYEGTQLLNDLVVEFEEKWAKYTKPFSSFLVKVWDPCMKNVLRRRKSVYPSTYESRLSGIGVSPEDIQRKTYLGKYAMYESTTFWDDSLDATLGNELHILDGVCLVEREQDRDENGFDGSHEDTESDQDYMSAHEEAILT